MSCPDGTGRSKHGWCDDHHHGHHRFSDWLYRQHIRRLYLREKLLHDEHLALTAQRTSTPPSPPQHTAPNNPWVFVALALALAALILAARRA